MPCNDGFAAQARAGRPLQALANESHAVQKERSAAEEREEERFASLT